MLDSAYTVRDTPAVVRRIDADLGSIVATVRQGDPHLRSLVLTGGFARAEGAVIEGVPQNDYDLVAVRGTGRLRVPYARMVAVLESRLGLHVDLAPVQAWRLPFVSPSIFWYETALAHRLLWGADLMHRVSVRDPGRLDRSEGLRLLVNRAAGLLLATARPDPHEHRFQAAKALLAASDVCLLERGTFPPSQRRRWRVWTGLRARGEQPAELAPWLDWVDWAFHFKMEPGSMHQLDAHEAWTAAARALQAVVPVALRHSGHGSLDRYAKRDGLPDRVVYLMRSSAVPGARRLLRNPTGRIRLATLRLLEASLDGRVREEALEHELSSVVGQKVVSLGMLERLRRATLQ